MNGYTLKKLRKRKNVTWNFSRNNLNIVTNEYANDQ